MPLINPKDAEDIYRSSEWAARRKQERAWDDVFTGKDILEAVDEMPDDLGEEQPKYPIGLTVAEVFAETHRDVLFGMPPSTDTSPVSILLSSDGDVYKDECHKLQQAIARIMYQSHGASLLMKAGLMMQVYGGWVFKITPDKNAKHLRHRIRVMGMEPSKIDPTYDLEDVWRLRECKIGYMISAADARDRYGVTPRKNKTEVVYMEHWTENEFRIIVDNVVPNVPGYGPFEGQHKIGRTPVLYLAHIPSGFWGMSHASKIANIEHEMNNRLTDKGDVADESAHQVLVGKNLRTAPKVELIKDGKNRAVRPFINIGTAQAIPNSPDPSMEYAKQSAIPESVSGLAEELLAYALIMTRVPEAAIGKVVKGTGRTTGPVTVAEMWAAISHATAERTEVSAGLREAADLMLREMALFQADGTYDELGVKLPKITEELMSEVTASSAWNPHVPLSVETESRMINEDVQAGTCSIEGALIRKRVRNVAEELARIQEDMRFKAEVEAEAQLKIAKMQAEQLKADTAKETAQKQADAVAARPAPVIKKPTTQGA